MTENKEDSTKKQCTFLVGAEQAAVLLGIGKTTFYRLKSRGKIPLPIHLGGRILWNRKELKEWVDAGCPPRLEWENKKT